MPNGEPIGYYKNFRYGLFKRRLNPLAGGTVDLILTGSFTRGLFVESKGNGIFTFDSNDDKTPDLISKYGSDIMGLNERAWRGVQIDTLLPLYIKELKRRLGQ